MIKNKIALLLILVGLLAPGSLWPKKLAEFDEVLEDPFVLMEKTHICIWSRSYQKIYIYKYPGFEKIAQFGKRGRGPGEFLSISSIMLKDEKIFVSNFPKISIFSLKGELLNEVKGTNRSSLVSFGKGYIDVTYPFTARTSPYIKTAFTLYDSNANPLKTIFETKTRKAPQTDTRKANRLCFAGFAKMKTFSDGLVIGSTEQGFYFAIFDLEGNLKCEIKKDFKKRRITDVEKKAHMDLLKNSTSAKSWKRCQMLYNYVFPDYYPAYEGFAVQDGRIYVFAFPKNNSREVQILDLKGKLLKRSSMPVINAYFCIHHDRYAIRDGIFYYLDENEETETWELHAIPIE